MQNFTPRDRYILHEACTITGTTEPATHSELAAALLNAATFMEQQTNPSQGNIDDMRTLLREHFLEEGLSELSAQERRQQFQLIDEKYLGDN